MSNNIQVELSPIAEKLSVFVSVGGVQLNKRRVRRKQHKTVKSEAGHFMSCKQN